MITAIILAGGMGTRLRSAVPDLPKPMAPIRGRPFLAHQMDFWIAQGVDRFVLSVGYRKEAILDYFGASYRNIPLSYALEEAPLGTGGGLLLAARGLDKTFLVLNGDTFFEVDLASLLKFHSDRASDWTFSLFKTSEAGRYLGMGLKADGRILSLGTDATRPDRLANGGVYLVSPSALADVPFVPGQQLSLEDDLLGNLMSRGCKLYGKEFSGRFIDIGVPADYFRAADLLTR